MTVELDELFLLLHKDLLVTFRKKWWLVFEIVLPLLVGLPLTYICVREAKQTEIPAASFPEFLIQGDCNDLIRKIKLVQTIENTYCRQPKVIGVAFGNGSTGGVFERTVADLQSRYNTSQKCHTPLRIHFKRYFSINKLHADLKADFNETVPCGRFLGGIVFHDFDLESARLRYTILMRASINAARWPDNKDIWVENNPFTILHDYKAVPYQPNLWSSGFLSLQYAVDSIFLKFFNDTTPDIELLIKRMPEASHHENSVMRFLTFLSLFFMGIALISIAHTAANISSEKESGMKSYLNVMGLHSITFYASHFIIATLKLSFVMLICTCSTFPVLYTVSGGLLILTTFCYAVGCVCLSLLISSLFHTANKAVGGAHIICSVMIVLGYSNRFSPPRSSFFYNVLCSLNIYFAFSKCIDCFTDSMLRETWFGWLNVFDNATSLFPFGGYFFMMIINCGWMLLLTAYLDQVYPYGDLPRKNPLFFLEFLRRNKASSSISITEIHSATAERDEMDANIEKECSSELAKPAGISIKNLTKYYGSKCAVSQLSLDAHQGSVTVLLGHNGAGKSTTFAMITGLATPSSGSISICGIEMNFSTRKSCQHNIGFCPQYNPLYSDLTVIEHLNLFRKLKRCDVDKSDEILERLQFAEFKNKPSKELSGGTRRKLCVAMALIGQSPVLLFDEPTAGMDTGARKLVDGLLQMIKSDRTILFTTHYMDEADEVGDRIAIMGKAKLICAGTSEFLKARFGTGYLLSLVFESTPSASLKNDSFIRIRKYVPNARLQSSTGHEITFLLPVENKTVFSKLFADLEENQRALQLKTFGVSLNTMEQVFLKVGEIADPTEGEDSADVIRRQASQIYRAEHGDQLDGIRLIFSQLRALFKKRYLSYKHSFSIIWSQIVLPLLIMIAYAIFLRDVPDQNEMVFPASSMAPALVALQSQNRITYPLTVSFAQMVGMVDGYELRRISKTEDMNAFFLRSPKVLPPYAFGSVINDSSESVKLFFNPNARFGPVFALTFLTNARLGRSPDSVTIGFLPYGVIDSFFSDVGKSFAVLIVLFVFPMMVATSVQFVAEENSQNFLHQLFLTRLLKITYWVSIFICDIIVYIPMCFIIGTILIVSGVMIFHPAYIVFWTLYFLAVMPFSHCISFWSANPSTSYTMALLLLTIPTLFVPPLLILLVTFFETVGRTAQIVCEILFPSISLAYEMYVFNVARSQMSDSSVLTWNEIWKEFDKHVYLSGCSVLLYWSLFLLLQAPITHQLLSSVWNIAYRQSEDSEEVTEYDVDVANERTRVETMPFGSCPLIVQRMNKFFGRFHAVKDLTFAVGTDECFGLLGVNGAGKTTTFDVIAGISRPSGGQVLINGKPSTCKQVIGFCPQYDALLPKLTAAETLNLVSSLCGYTDIEKRVSTILSAIALTDEADKKVEQMSGGQKRRLSIGVALLSPANFVMLDEPTAGVDPKVRRHVWNLLCAMRCEHRAILLTSHSMEECETLCTRIGIMHSGRLIAIGSPQHIKSRFGDGYSLTITLENLTEKAAIEEAVKRKFPTATFKPLPSSHHLFWNIKKSDADKWSVLFRKAHVLSSSFSSISDYSLAQTTLLDAFMRLVKYEDVPKDCD